MSPRCLVTTPIPEPGGSLLAASGSVTGLPSPPDHETLHRLCASGDFDVVLTRLRDVSGSVLGLAGFGRIARALDRCGRRAARLGRGAPSSGA